MDKRLSGMMWQGPEAGVAGRLWRREVGLRLRILDQEQVQDGSAWSKARARIGLCLELWGNCGPEVWGGLAEAR